MNTESELKIIDLYRSYQLNRTASGMEKNTPMNDVLQNSGAVAANHDEERIISLYKQFQRNRTPDCEQVIENVMNVAKLHINQQRIQHVKSDLKKNQTIETSTFLNRLFSWLQNRSVGSWQTAAVFSLALVVSAIFSTLYLIQDVQSPIKFVAIPDMLFTHSQTIVENIEPNLNNQFGFSSNNEHHQSAFQAGVLSVQLPLLTAADNWKKLKKTTLMSTSFIQQTENPELIRALNRLVKDIEVSKDREKLNKSINDFNAMVREHFVTLGTQSLLELGKWVEISLLSTQLPKTNRLPVFKQLLPQGRDIASRAITYFPDETVVVALVEETLNHDGETVSTDRGVVEFRKKLQKLKAALL